MILFCWYIFLGHPVELNNGDDDGDGDDAEKRDIRQILAGGQVRSVA